MQGPALRIHKTHYVCVVKVPVQALRPMGKLFRFQLDGHTTSRGRGRKFVVVTMVIMTSMAKNSPYMARAEFVRFEFRQTWFGSQSGCVGVYILPTGKWRPELITRNGSSIAELR